MGNRETKEGRERERDKGQRENEKQGGSGADRGEDKEIRVR